MGLFGEGYSKEALEAAEADVEMKKDILHDKKHDLRYKTGMSSETDAYGRVRPASWREDEAAADLHKSMDKRDRIYAAGQGEAINLERKHQRLIAELERAKENLLLFEREKLGMHQITEK